MDTLAQFRDRCWLWAHAAGSHDNQYGLPGPSTITPADAAASLGLHNVIYVCYRNEPTPPFIPHAAPLRDCERLVWSIVGDSSTTRNDRQSDLDAVLELATRQPNLCGGIMDDFFALETDNDDTAARWDVDALGDFRQRLHEADLDLWVVVYDHQLDRPLQAHLAQCDVVTFWTWRAGDLAHLATNVDRLRRLAPRQRLLLGCYMWDYGNGCPMPLDLFQQQCEQGRAWLEAGRIDGLIFLASCLCDQPVATVSWLRSWLAG